MNNSSEKQFGHLISQYGEAEVFPIVTRFPADLLTPFGAYLKLSKNAEFSFLFESVEGGESLARYSFLGADPEFIAKENKNQTLIISGDTTTNVDTPIYEYIKQALYKRKVADVSNLPSFIGGGIGYFDFSAVEYFEPILKKSKKIFDSNSQSQFAFYKTIVAFDHARQEIAIISLVFSENSNTKEELLLLFEEAKIANEKVIQRLEVSEFPKISNNTHEIDQKISSNWDKEDFKTAVTKIKELINAGECYQVVLSQCFSKQTNAEPETIYRALRSLNPSPYMIF